MAEDKPKVTVQVKEFKLREGFTHSHDGHVVGHGDTVFLTKQQANAFRDRFEPVDSGGEFKDMDAEEARYDPSKAKSTKSKEKGAKPEETGPTKDAPQGQPPAQPPIHVDKGAPATGPTDPNSLDPARQGQQSREQRALIDSGNAPLAAVNLGEEERKKAMAGGEPEGKKSTGAPAGATAKA